MNCDVLIQGARVVDGTGRPWFRGDLAVSGHKISAVGSLKGWKGAVTIAGEDRYLCPGFVDAHVHSDLALLENRDFAPATMQGVTSHIIGQDGISYAPLGRESLRETVRYFAAINGAPNLSYDWTTPEEYLAEFDRGASVNVAWLAPHGALRISVMGHGTGAPTSSEMREMQTLLKHAMDAGAVGLSTGLDYMPCHYASTEELTRLCEPVADAGGVFVAHMRSYGEWITEAVEEMKTVSSRAKIPVHISHYNGRADHLLAMIDSARREGVDVTFDTYPYLAGCTMLSMVALPRWAEEGGVDATLARLRDPATRPALSEAMHDLPWSWQDFQISSVSRSEDEQFAGMRLTDAAAAARKAPVDFICDLLAANDLAVCAVVFHTNRDERDVRDLMKHPAHMGGSDGIFTGSHPHPRGFGTHARYLSEYGRDNPVMPIEELVSHLTWRAASRFGLSGRGLVAPGWFADLCLFDLDEIAAPVDYANGAQLARGMSDVFVNGRPVLRDGKMTGERPGVSLRRNT